MQVVPVACLKDNYAYLIIDGARAVVVDPSEAPPIEAALKANNVSLGAIWATHHHWDHTGGIKDLVAAHPGIDVVIGAEDAAKVKDVTFTRTVADGDELVFGALRAKVIHNPGHTLGAVTFLVDGCAFTGDTLFCAGCGRVFEGDPAMMHASLQKLAALPPETKVYCGHEYTAGNLKFAAAVEPDNQDVASWQASLATPSVPSTIATERAANPFLRVPDAAEFARIREWKNSFK